MPKKNAQQVTATSQSSRPSHSNDPQNGTLTHRVLGYIQQVSCLLFPSTTALCLLGGATPESVRVQVNLAIRAQNRQKSRIFHIDALAYITIVSFYGKDGHFSDHVVLVLTPQTVTPNPP